MNQKFIFKHLVLWAVLGVGASACSDSFLDQPVKDPTPEDYFSANANSAQELVMAVYANGLTWEQHSFSWVGISSITSDDADKGSDPGDTGTDKDKLDEWTFSPSELSFLEIWRANYNGISRANKALYILPNLEINAAVRMQLMGEAKFLRAYYYFNLVRMFGGVPKIERLLTSPEEIDAAMARASATEIYDFMEQDLNDAAAALPVEYASSAVGRATQGAAKGLLSKVHLYQQEWSQAAAAASEVINSGRYALLADYAKIWREEGENSSESLFEFQAKGLDPNQLGIPGYYVTQAPRGAGGLGWGFNTPTADLAAVYEAGDVRKDATIITSGQVLWDGFVTNAAAPNPRYNYKSYVSKTNETFNPGNDWNANKNLRILRYAEILLIYAEAASELGQLADAQNALNQVRNRAGLGNTTAATQTDLRQAIWRERRVELAFEHERTFDLRRQGRAGAVLRAHGKNYVDGKHDLFPIPQREIDISNGKLTQNDGY